MYLHATDLFRWGIHMNDPNFAIWSIGRTPFREPQTDASPLEVIARDGSTVFGMGRVMLEDGAIVVSVDVDSARDYFALQRRYTGGNLAHDDTMFTIRSTKGAWSCQRCWQWRGISPETVIFRTYAPVQMPAEPDLSLARYFRSVYRGGAAYGDWTQSDRRFSIVPPEESIGRDVLSLTMATSAAPTEVEHEALWLLLCLLSGVFLQNVCEEAYDANGTLIAQWHRLGDAPTTEDLSPFRGIVPPSTENLARMHEALYTMLTCGFKIGRVIGHLLEPTGGFWEHEALHLTLAIHSAVKQWASYWKTRSQNKLDAEAADARRQQRAQGLIVSPAVYPDIRKALDSVVDKVLNEAGADDRLRTALHNAIASGNNASLVEKVSGFLEGELGVTLAAEDKRALGYRNQLAHEGGFAIDFVDLSYEQLNERHIDINRLRNIGNEVVLRLCGYVGPARDYCPPLGVRQIEGYSTAFVGTTTTS